jgi:NitT/TauT family transport system permease protein
MPDDVMVGGPAATGTVRTAKVSEAAWRTVLFKTVLHPKVASILVIVLAWAIAALALPSDVLPSPADVWHQFTYIVGGGEILKAIGVTMERIVIAWAVAGVIGLTLGVLMASARIFNTILRDWVLIIMSLPLVMWALLGVLWFGGSVTASIVAGAAVAFPFTAVNIYEGVAAVDRDLLRMAKVYRLPKLTVLRRVMVPSMMPFIFASGRQSFAMVWKTIAILEVFGASSGMGWEIEAQYERNSLAGVFVWIILFCAIMMVIELLVFSPFEKFTFRWRPQIGDLK